jgi:putative transposase
VGVALRRICITSKSKAEDALYDDLRDETDLTANLVQRGIRHAIHAVTGGVEKLKQGEKTSQPEFDSWSVVYDKRSATFNADHATLSTPNGRVKADYVLPPEDEREDTPFGRYYESDDWDGSGATLQYDEQDNTFYLHVTLKNPDYEVDGTERQEAESQDDHEKNGTVLGLQKPTTRMWTAPFSRILTISARTLRTGRSSSSGPTRRSWNS